MANEIITGGGGSSGGVATVTLDFTSLSKIDGLLTDTENIINNNTNNKLVQVVNSIYTAINNSDAVIGSKIFNLAQSINTSINTASNTTNLKLQAGISLINSELDKTESVINTNLSKVAYNVTNQLDTVQRNIMNSIAVSANSTEDEIREQTTAIKMSAIAIRDGIVAVLETLPSNLISAIDNSEIVSFIKETITDDTLTSNLGVSNWLGSLQVYLMERMGDVQGLTWLDKLRTTFDKLATNRYTNIDEFMNDIKDLFGSNFLISSLVGMGVFVSTVWQLIWSIGEPFAKNVLQLSASVATPNELSSAELLRLHVLGFIDENTLYSRLKEIGYNNRNSEDIENLKFNTLTENQVRVAYQRGILSQEDLQTQKKRLGYTDYNWSIAQKLWEYYPTPPDVVSFANRDVFEPDVVQEFGLDQELSDEYLKLAKQIGLSEQFARWYWYAHWYLPSLTQGYEMLHRGIITPEQLDKLFKAQDIVPFWRDKLKAISYTPLVRVDVRRIHKMGIISDEDLIQSYKNTGYNQKDAEIMAQWTKAYNGMGGDDGYIDTKNLTRSLIVKAYTNGMFDRVDAIGRLMELGHTFEDSEIIIDLASLEDYVNSIPKEQQDNAKRIQDMVEYGVINGLISKAEAKDQLTQLGMSENTANSELAFLEWEKFISIRELLIKNLRTKYIRYIIPKNEVLSTLRNNGFNNDEIEDLFTSWDIIRDDRDGLPTKAELEEMLRKGVIGAGQWVDYMRGLGYSDSIIEHYKDLIFIG